MTEVYQLLITTALSSHSEMGRTLVDRILLALLFHCSRDQDHGRAIKTFDNALAREDKSFRILDYT